MPQPRTKNSRRNRLSHRSNPPATSAAPVNGSDEAEEIANEACGNRRYEVVAPRTLSAAKSPSPIGPKSVEYAPPSAISDRSDVYDPRLNIYGRRMFQPDETARYLTFEGLQRGIAKAGALEIAFEIWQGGILMGYRLETEVEIRYGSGSRSVPDPTRRPRTAKPTPQTPTVPSVRVWRSDPAPHDVQEPRRQMGDFADDEHSEPLDTEGEED